jgi:hypothetical protein
MSPSTHVCLPEQRLTRPAMAPQWLIHLNVVNHHQPVLLRAPSQQQCRKKRKKEQETRA